MPVIPAAARAPSLSAPGPLDEIRSLVMNDLPALTSVEKGGEDLMDLAPVWRWLAAAQRDGQPSIRRPRVALFLGRHGAHTDKQTGLPLLLAGLKEGTHTISKLVQEANADLQVYELDLGVASKDFRAENALTDTEAAQAIAYGMMAVQPGIDLLLVCAPNPVAEITAAEITRALKSGADPFDSLLRFGGFDVAAMTGAIVAARLAHIPVLLEGGAAEAAAALLAALNADAAAHARPSSSLIAEKTAFAPPCRGVLMIPLLKAIALAV